MQQLVGTSQLPPLQAAEDLPIYSHHSPSKLQEIESIRRNLMVPKDNEDKLLWEVLDKGRMRSHIKVRKNPFLKQLESGGFCQTEFMKYLVNLLPIHKALEEAQQMLTDKHLSVFVIPELFRSEAIEQDLKIWESVAAQEFVPWKPSGIALEYADYIRETAMRDPEKIIAIMYTLYGTIMSGGQKNKSVVGSALTVLRGYMDDVPEGSGVALYEINNVKNAAELDSFKYNWHERLCLVELQMPAGSKIDAFHTKLVDEVVLAFDTVLNFIQQDVEKGHC